VISGKNTTPESLARSESGCLSFNFWEPSELCGRHRCGGAPGSTSATDPSATLERPLGRSGRSGWRYRFGGPSVGRSEPYPHSEAGGEQGGHHLGSKPSQLATAGKATASSNCWRVLSFMRPPMSKANTGRLQPERGNDFCRGWRRSSNFCEPRPQLMSSYT
jgi:hypothetical protein